MAVAPVERVGREVGRKAVAAVMAVRLVMAVERLVAVVTAVAVRAAGVEEVLGAWAVAVSKEATVVKMAVERVVVAMVGGKVAMAVVEEEKVAVVMVVVVMVVVVMAEAAMALTAVGETAAVVMVEARGVEETVAVGKAAELTGVRMEETAAWVVAEMVQGTMAAAMGDRAAWVEQWAALQVAAVKAAARVAMVVVATREGAGIATTCSSLEEQVAMVGKVTVAVVVKAVAWVVRTVDLRVAVALVKDIRSCSTSVRQGDLTHGECNVPSPPRKCTSGHCQGLSKKR